MSSNKRILWSANDPGGMNAIAPVARALEARGDSVFGIAAGPAVAIAQQSGLAVQDVGACTREELAAAVEAASPDIFLAGTSAGDSIDKKIFRLIPETPSVYVLDFWSNYRMRFSTAGDELGYLPTAICVMDELAREEMLNEGIPDEYIHVTGNPHMEHFTEHITRDREDGHQILFISQPVREIDGDQYGFDEYTALRDLAEVVRELPEPYRVSVRLHPKDQPDKYQTMLGGRAALTAPRPLEEDLSEAGLVAGMFSPVLIQAAAAGKKVLSYEPGLSKADPLVTNRMGLTFCAHNKDELQSALRRYAAGEYQNAAVAVEKIWPKGATVRVMKVLDSLVANGGRVL